MAKKIQAAEIVIKTTDGGSFKLTGKEAEKLTKKMNQLGGASQQTDRRIKGVTQQSSNATKNFSKQAQTMQGGLVAVYATIAAQVFAVSAAFQFLKSSMETRNLIAGQEAFGSVTGTAYKSLTQNIQDATNGMLNFKAAASSAAIGVAAGLSSSQLEGLGVAATNASLALGRDLEDSFNRLIRGVTKAEPELLDELGIILRLENATDKYAVSVGKTREQLNAYERTQAVLNDVLEQAETKYGKIQEKMDPDAFAMGQFAKEMDDLLLSFQEFVMKGIVPLLNFFKDNTGALIAAVLLFVRPIIAQILPNLNTALDTSKAKFKSSFDEMKASAKGAGDAFAGIGQAFGADVDMDPKKSKKTLEGMGVKMKGKDQKAMSQRQISAYRRMMHEKKGIFMKMTRDERRAFKMHLNIQEANLKGHTMKQVATTQLGENSKRAAWKTSQMVYNGTLMAMRAATTAAAWAMNMAMKAAGIIGILFMVVEAIKAVVKWFQNLDEEAAKARKETEELTGKLEDLNAELEKMVDIRTEDYLLDLKMSVEQAGQAFQSMDLPAQIKAYNKELNKGMKVGDDTHTQFMKLAKSAAQFDSRYDSLVDEMSSGEQIIGKSADGYRSISSEIINASEASKRFAQNQQTVNKMLDKQIRKFKDVPYKDLVDAYTSSISDMKDSLVFMESDMATRAVRGKERADEIRDKELFNLDKARYDQDNKGTAGSDFLSTKMKQWGDTQADFKKLRTSGLFGPQGAYSLAGGDEAKDKFNAYLEETYGGSDATKKQKQIRSNLMKWFKSQQALYSELAEIGAQPTKDTEQINLINEKIRVQEKMRGRALNLQAMGIEFANTRLTAELNLVKAQKAGMNVANKKDQIDQQVILNSNAVNKAVLDREGAELAVFSILEKQIQAKVGEGKTVAEQEKIQARLAQKENETYEEYKARLILQKEGLDFADQELTQAESFVLNAQTNVDIETTRKKIKDETLRIDKLLLDHAIAMETATRNQAKWQREVAIAKKQAALDEKLFGGSAGKREKRRVAYEAAGTTITGLQGMVTQYSNQADAITEEGGGALGGVRDSQGLIIDANTQAQLRFNAIKEKEIAAQHQINLLLIERNKLESEDASEFLTAKAKANTEEMKFQREKVFTLNPAQKEFNDLLLIAKRNGQKIDEDVLSTLKEQAIATKSLAIEVELVDGIQKTLSAGFESMFQAMIDGTKSFKESMKDLTRSVLADLAAMFMKAAALKFLLAMFPGMGNWSMFSTGGLASSQAGAIKPPAKVARGGPGGYSDGGISTGPTSGYQATLHGTEAVVPLPNGKSIPVQMSGGGGNIVNVTVNMSGNGQSQSSVTGTGGQALGRQIGSLVQQHLQQQMQPGGLLNPQGSQGRNR